MIQALGFAAVVSIVISCHHVQGLAVELRPYQRQSLKFMMDSESAEGGFRHHLFCSVVNSKGVMYWYSPILGRICQHVTPMPQGGILGRILTPAVGITVCLITQCITVRNHQQVHDVGGVS